MTVEAMLAEARAIDLRAPASLDDQLRAIELVEALDIALTTRSAARAAVRRLA